MGELYGSIVHCPYIEGDAKNLRVEYRAENKGKDMKATLDYFEELKKEDPDFYYNYTLDDEDRVENLFWVDGAARKAYELYDNCISFDTTYLTNAYNMPCSPFIGIDRNGLTIQLGCRFLRNEKTDDFIWLFTEFKKAMGGKDPVTIITDQDLAMKAAIGEVFTTSIHRNQELSDDFKDCLDNSFLPSKFEGKWQVFLDKHGLNDDEIQASV
ncbi:protein FAR1-RELATED SEQUENCE 5-like [Setaria viridis]|uniref:protein FAR1-RELATED SEQUENCE 5-like n=1 Tax=Setaria viridis TaxID=4556 RepID=UPI003B3AE78F